MTKKDQTTTIEVRSEIYHMISELREQFADMTNNPDLKDEDVLAVLINGFIESVEQSQGGCCGNKNHEQCGCHH